MRTAAGRVARAAIVCAAALGLMGPAAHAQGFDLYRVEEASIADIRRAFETGDLTCRRLVAMYLDRIEAYDRRGPSLNAIVSLHPGALDRAAELDRAWAGAGPVGPLHCVPVIVKDNYETFDLPTRAGSASFGDWMAPKDAFQVRKIREAGAIILAKSNMAEFAFTPYETIGSALPGYTFNPYALNRVPAGSSGGTAAAVAANFGAVGLGTDTGNSIRGPSSHTALVGIRSTMGLTSRAGIVPLNLARDIGGPMARSVEDAVAVFEVIAGFDPDDPATEASRGRVPDSYRSFLDLEGLRDARIGVAREISNTDTADPRVLELMERALDDMRARGAVIVEPVDIPGLDEIRFGNCNRFKHDLNRYLEALGPNAPVADLDAIIDSDQFHFSIRERLESARGSDLAPRDDPECRRTEAGEDSLREALLGAMDGAELDALVYPTWNNPPRLIGDLDSPHGNNSQRLSPPTGFPAITVPMGWIEGSLPAGLQFLGRPWSEGTLIRLVYAYEQATRHRRPPPSVPPLP